MFRHHPQFEHYSTTKLEQYKCGVDWVCRRCVEKGVLSPRVAKSKQPKKPKKPKKLKEDYYNDKVSDLLEEHLSVRTYLLTTKDITPGWRHFKAVAEGLHKMIVKSTRITSKAKITKGLFYFFYGTNFNITDWTIYGTDHSYMEFEINPEWAMYLQCVAHYGEGYIDQHIVPPPPEVWNTMKMTNPKLRKALLIRKNLDKMNQGPHSIERDDRMGEVLAEAFRDAAATEISIRADHDYL